MFENLPGGEIAAIGLEDITNGVQSTEALLLHIAAPRLRSHGLPIPTDHSLPTAAEELLYEKLVESLGDGAYMQYKALLRKLVSFQDSLDALR